MVKTNTILIADDEPDLRDILRSVLEAEGYTVIEASDGQMALETVRATPPDMIILDYMMPRMTGPQVCAMLKTDMLLRHLPILLLTGKSEVKDKIDGINAGADDYLIKPFEPRELVARVKMVLRRTAQELEANPLTRLPGNVSIQRELEQRIAGKKPFATCYVDLDKFKAFNDHYGFTKGDDAIRETARIMLEAMQESGTGQDFIGHIGGDDFILITDMEHVDRLCEAVVKKFDAMVPALYDPKTREQGYLVHEDREGRVVKIPLLMVSIAVVTTEQYKLEHPAQIAEIGADLKAYAKQFQKSLYVKERRKPPEAPAVGT